MKDLLELAAEEIDESVIKKSQESSIDLFCQQFNIKNLSKGRVESCIIYLTYKLWAVSKRHKVHNYNDFFHEFNKKYYKKGRFYYTIDPAPFDHSDAFYRAARAEMIARLTEEEWIKDRFIWHTAKEKVKNEHKEKFKKELEEKGLQEYAEPEEMFAKKSRARSKQESKD